jgi:hypothetical protein
MRGDRGWRRSQIRPGKEVGSARVASAAGASVISAASNTARCWRSQFRAVSGRPKHDRFRKETDSRGDVEVPADKLCGAQTQRSLELFSIGQDLILREIIEAYAI